MLQVIPTLFLLFMQGALGSDPMPGRWDLALLRMAASQAAPRQIREVVPDPHDSEDANRLARIQLLSWLAALDGATEPGDGSPIVEPDATQNFPQEPASHLAKPDHGFGGLTRDGPNA